MTETGPGERNPELDQLLPWYVNDTLSEEERRLVAEYLDTSPQAREEIAFLQSLRARTKETPPVNTPGELGLQRLERRIAQERQSARRSPNWWRPAAIAATLVLVVQSAVLVQTWREDSGVVPAGGQQAPGVVLQVTFAPSATEKEIRALLQSIEGSLVGGPSALGVYTLRLSDLESNDTTEIERAIQALRARGDIVSHVDLAR